MMFWQKSCAVAAASALALSLVPGVAVAAPASSVVSSSRKCPTMAVIVVGGLADNMATDRSFEEDTQGRLAGVVGQAKAEARAAAGDQTIEDYYVNWRGSSEDEMALAQGESVGEVAEKRTFRQGEELSIEDTKALLGDISRQCPDTKFFLVGQTEGAGSAHKTLAEVGAGHGPVSAERIAGGALYSDPYRAASAPVFAGDRPQVPEGVTLPEGALSTPSSASPLAGIEAGDVGTLGSLKGRVGQFCLPLDPVCARGGALGDVYDTLSVGLQGKELAGNPLSRMGSVVNSFGGTLLATGADTITNDISFNWEKGQFEIAEPKESVLARAAGYRAQGVSLHDPHVANGVVRAGIHVAGMGLGAAVTVAKKMISPAAIASYVAAGSAGATAGTAVGGAVGTAAGGLLGLAGGAIGSAAGAVSSGGPLAFVAGPVGALLGGASTFVSGPAAGAIGGAAGAALGVGGAVAWQGMRAVAGLIPPQTVEQGAQWAFAQVKDLGLEEETISEATQQAALAKASWEDGYRESPLSSAGASPYAIATSWMAGLASALAGAADDAVATLFDGGSLLEHSDAVLPGATLAAGEVLPAVAQVLTGLLG